MHLSNTLILVSTSHYINFVVKVFSFTKTHNFCDKRNCNSVVAIETDMITEIK